jgi:AcrR family transcriptional regulator
MAVEQEGDVMSDTPQSTRAHRRAQRRAAILEAARQEFARRGYEAATIRAVAEEAGCDPSLVMQHFGSKQELFRAASGLHLDIAELAAGPRETLSERLVRGFFEQTDAQPEAIASTLRSMLTHDQSADEAVKLFNAGATAISGTALAGRGDELADLRGQLIGALTLGTAITRYVLKSSAVRQASMDDLVTCLQPAVETLLSGRDAENGGREMMSRTDPDGVDVAGHGS